MTDKEAQIIREYEKLRLTHPKMAEIASIVGVSKSYVHQTIKTYVYQNIIFGMKGKE